MVVKGMVGIGIEEMKQLLLLLLLIGCWHF
jgi:hypothetical protein